MSSALTKKKFTLHVDSKDRAPGGTPNDFRVLFGDRIRCPADERITLDLYDFICPYTFPQISKNNNELVMFLEPDITTYKNPPNGAFTTVVYQGLTRVDMTLPEGRYNDTSLRGTVFSSISSQLSGTSWSLNSVDVDPITRRLKMRFVYRIVVTGYQDWWVTQDLPGIPGLPQSHDKLTATVFGSAHRVFGVSATDVRTTFTHNIVLNSYPTQYTGDMSIELDIEFALPLNMTPDHALFLHCDMHDHNLSTAADGQVELSNVLARIPITVAPFDTIYYRSETTDYNTMTVPYQHLESLHLRVTNDRGHPIEMVDDLECTFLVSKDKINHHGDEQVSLLKRIADFSEKVARYTTYQWLQLKP